MEIWKRESEWNQLASCCSFASYHYWITNELVNSVSQNGAGVGSEIGRNPKNPINTAPDVNRFSSSVNLPTPAQSKRPESSSWKLLPLHVILIHWTNAPFSKAWKREPFVRLRVTEERNVTREKPDGVWGSIVNAWGDGNIRSVTGKYAQHFRNLFPQVNEAIQPTIDTETGDRVEWVQQDERGTEWSMSNVGMEAVWSWSDQRI
jgi:hypothetical protein